MPFVPTLNGIKVELRMLLAGQQIENCFHVRTRGASPGSVLEDVAIATYTWAAADYFDNLSEDVTLREVYATDISSATGPVYTATSEITTVGAVTEPSVANNVAFCLSLRTDSRGRSYRGRWYVAGFTRLAVNDSAVPGSFANALVASVDALADALSSLDVDMGVLSLVSNGVPRTEGVITPITSITYTDLTVDSQRRRLPGRGR